MTIASAFNEIAVEQGGTAAKSGAITAAIDALNDALAGSDQPQAKTIEEAVRLLGEHIGGGGGSSYSVKCYTSDGSSYTEVQSAVYMGVIDEEEGEYAPDIESGVISSANAGDVLCVPRGGFTIDLVMNTTETTTAGWAAYPATPLSFTMPSHDACVVLASV